MIHYLKIFYKVFLYNMCRKPIEMKDFNKPNEIDEKFHN